MHQAQQLKPSKKNIHSITIEAFVEMKLNKSIENYT